MFTAHYTTQAQYEQQYFTTYIRHQMSLLLVGRWSLRFDVRLRACIALKNVYNMHLFLCGKKQFTLEISDYVWYIIFKTFIDYFFIFVISFIFVQNFT